MSSSCPVPVGRYTHIVLGHGSGGRLSQELLEQVFLPAFSGSALANLEDQALLRAPSEPGARLAFTTDSFVVSPLFFPGGDIGRLAVCGTVNDLCVGGAIAHSLSVAFVLEEGLLIDDLRRIVASMAATCREAGVEIVTGDTKVVDKGKADGVFITTSGLGVVPAGRSLSISNARVGDALLVSGPIGDHGVAILSVREGIDFETSLLSDCAPLASLTHALLEVSQKIHLMRDPTRGGLSGVLHDIARHSRVGVWIDEARVPVRAEVRAASDMLGLDPLYIACEGRLVAAVAPEDAERILATLRAHPLGQGAAIIGQVVSEQPGVVRMRSRVGGERVVPLLSGEQLPRIC
ncbi:MAG TPA: hydrogenase expression/formation protein HypE [Polyangiaceae bacterium]|nr:hydrogenase expression/formation protein HypE [Polyangiaceae bacterium]